LPNVVFKYTGPEVGAEALTALEVELEDAAEPAEDTKVAGAIM
jgi:hypothetical protein